jgi:acetyl-CoA acyltransferase 1
VLPAAIDRLSQLGSQITGGASAGGKAKLLEKNPDDVGLTGSHTTARDTR